MRKLTSSGVAGRHSCWTCQCSCSQGPTVGTGSFYCFPALLQVCFPVQHWGIVREEQLQLLTLSVVPCACERCNKLFRGAISPKLFRCCANGSVGTLLHLCCYNRSSWGEECYTATSDRDAQQRAPCAALHTTPTAWWCATCSS